MKVALVYPPWQFDTPSKLPPLGVSLLAANLRHRGYRDVAVVDLNVEMTDHARLFARAVRRVAAKGPDVVGLTCWTVHLPFCLEFTRALKQAHPEITVVLGGVHATARPRELLDLCPADVVVRGEGDETLPAVVRALDARRPLDGIAGITYRAGTEIRETADRALVHDLDTLPFPAYELLPPLHAYQPLNRRYVFSVVASRGCPYRCIFCSASLGKTQRRRSPGAVATEVRWLVRRHGAGFIRFEDDTLTLDRDWALALFAGLRDLGVGFECLTRLDAVDTELLQAMRAAGGEGIYHGLETASPRLLKLLRKGFGARVTLDGVAELVRTEVALGLQPTVSAMIGIPTETLEEVRATIDFMSRLRREGARTQLWIMTPYPDTPAATMYADRLLAIDRWHELAQFDVFSAVPRAAYGDVLKRYTPLVPDNWMFRTAVASLDEMKALYLEGATRVLGELEFV